MAPPASQPFVTPNGRRFRPTRTGTVAENGSTGPGSTGRTGPGSTGPPTWRRHTFLPPQPPAQHTPPSVLVRRQFSTARRHATQAAEAIEDGSSPPAPARTVDVAARVPLGETDDIEDVPARSPVHAPDQDVDVDDDVDDAVVPDSLERADTTPTPTPTPTPVPTLPTAVRPPHRLLSSAQPFKRRRLFVPDEAITSSPGDAVTDEPTETRRHAWDIDDEDDDEDESDKEDDDDEETRDMLAFGELVEDADADDDDDDDDEHKTETTKPRHAFTRARLFASTKADTVMPDDGDERLPDALPPPDFFSPRKKRTRVSVGRTDKATTATTAKTATTHDGQFVAGGLAAELRGWLVQIKSAEQTPGRAGRYAVAGLVSAGGLSLGWGQRGDAPRQRLLLPGRVEAGAESVVVVAPAWEAIVDGQAWTVASRWQ